MIKNRLLLLFSFIGLPIASLSSDEFMQMQKFYYEQGYKEGAKKYYAKGIEDYQEYIVENVLPKYKAKFEAIEATKYLLKENYITYPESYRQSNNGSYKVIFTEPKIERPIDAEVLFRMPEYKVSDTEKELDSKYEEKNVSKKKEEFKNGLQVVDDLNSREEIPNSVSSIREEVTLSVNKTRSNLDMIQKLNLKHLDSFSGYKVYFKNKTEKAEFCFQLTGDSTCSSVN
ncbi:hypothetical protein [Aliarcobacter butzleri]|uniref:hypothetical protein n=1 Tax=Aliarcobacter butzleri TaxID=28197 RepID=UPI001269C26F|nr:hypothetical protein [Aliarcobacter butzleri]